MQHSGRTSGKKVRLYCSLVKNNPGGEGTQRRGAHSKVRDNATKGNNTLRQYIYTKGKEAFGKQVEDSGNKSGTTTEGKIN